MTNIRNVVLVHGAFADGPAGKLSLTVAPTAIELGCADPANPCALPNAPPRSNLSEQVGLLGGEFFGGYYALRVKIGEPFQF
jgi:hypothetical protein